MKRTIIKPTSPDLPAKFTPTIQLAMSEYAHEEQLRKIRAGREWRKRQDKR